MRENLLKKQPTWGLRRAQGTGQKSATPATLTKVIWVLLTMLLLPSAAWGQESFSTKVFQVTGDQSPYTYKWCIGDDESFFWETFFDAAASNVANSGVYCTGQKENEQDVQIYQTAGNFNAPLSFLNTDNEMLATIEFKLAQSRNKSIKAITINLESVSSGVSISACGQNFTSLIEGENTLSLSHPRLWNDNFLITISLPHNSSVKINSLSIETGMYLGVTVAEVPVTSDINENDILGDGTVSFTAASGTNPAILTLNGATLGTIDESNTQNSYLVSIVSELDALTINLQGGNKLYGTITCSSDNSTSDNATLAFTGNGSLEISGKSSTINGFTSVDFGEFNLASKSAPGIHWEVDERALNGFEGPASDVTITKASYYPIWVHGSTDIYATHTQLTEADTPISIGGGTISFDGEHTITVSTVNFNIESTTMIIVGPDMQELTINLIGANSVRTGSSFLALWNTTPLTFTFTTNENSPDPGNVTAPTIVSWMSDNSQSLGGQITYENGLVFNLDATTSTETISTTGVRLKIGDTPISTTGDIEVDGGTAHFNASNNTLTLTGATIGTATASKNIQALVDDLKVVISGNNTISGDITYSGNSGQSSSIQINKAEEATPASLTMKNIEQFGACTWGDGLYLSANNSVDVRYEFEDGEGGFCSYYGDISTVTISTNLSYPLWINGIQATEGSVTGTGIAKNGESVSEWGITFIPATNTLKLQNVLLSTDKDQTPAIISGLDNLNIQIEGDNNVSNTGSYGGYTALSTKSNAVLTITTEDDGQLNTTNGSSSYIANPFHGFQSVTFNGDLIYIGGTGCQYIRNLGDPGISLSSENKLTLSSSHDDYGSHYVSYYYTLDFADSDENDISTPTLLSKDEEGPTIAEACTITAYISYEYKGNEYNDYEYGTLKKTGENNPAIGKYFKVADKTIVFNSTTSVKASDLELSPTTKNEGVSIQNIYDAYNSYVISKDNGQYTIAGIGSCNVEVNISVANDAVIQVLNRDGEVIRAIGEVTVVPDKPTITIEKNDPERNYYLNTDEIAITRTSVEGENTDYIKIFYTWGDATIGSNYFHYTDNPTLSIYDATKPILAQTGTLRAWVGYHLGDNEYLMSDEVESEKFTVKTDISDYTVQGLATSATYTGAAIVPAFSVKASADAETSLTLNTDYTVSYQSVIIAAGDVGSGPSINYTDVDEMVEVGAYRIVITGTGDNYGGTTYADFAIDKADLSDYVVTGLTTPTSYTGSPITPTFSVKATEEAETSLTANTDYSVKYQQAGADVDEMKDAGAYKIIISGEGNYKGSKSVDFTIERAQLQELNINLEGWTYGDTPNVPSLDGNLDEGDITWEYKAAGAEAYSAWSTLTTTTDAGTYMVRATVAETDNYAGGSKEAEFVIEQLDISQADITLDNTVLTYNGEQQTVNVTKVMAGDIEVPIDCYEVSGNTEKEAGDYKLTVTAKTVDGSGNPIKNNFTGTAEKAWKINHRTASAEELGFKSETQTASTYYNSDEDFNLPEGYVAYIITGINGNSVTTQRVSYIPNGVAVLVEKGQSSESPNDATPYSSTLPLKGTQEPVDVTSITGGTVYVLYNGEFVKSTSGTIPAHRCYLLIPDQIASGTRSFGIDHGDGTTSLREVKGEKWADGEWYTLQGQRIAKPAKGLYILNGKKVVIK